MAVDRTRPIYSFLPWIRQGIPGSLAGTQVRSEIVNGRIGWTIRLVVNDDTTRPIDTEMRLYGPGDITGIDPREIVRVDPPHLTADFEPAYFPLIEFDRPDFPWLFTPAAPAGDKLAPWLCLVVVPKRDPTAVAPASPLPVLTCRRGDLPDLALASQWAHAQVTWTPATATGEVPGEASLKNVIDATPERTVARILSTRPLDAGQAYYACLVPTYDVGRKAGLGEEITPDDERALGPAWTATGSADDTVRLPVYYHWEFATGVEHSFEALARRLRPIAADGSTPATPIGRTVVTLDSAGWEIWNMKALEPKDATTTFDGVFVATAGTPGAASDAPVEVRTRLEQILSRPDVVNGSAVVLPPLYGSIQAQRPRLPADKPWMRQLNLHPSYRIAAGLGALVVRYQQEQLMAAAWEQAAERQRADRQRTRDQLAIRVNGALVERLASLPAEEAAQVTQPVHARVTVGTISVEQQVRDSTLPAAALSPSFRGLVRPQGPLSRRLRADADTQVDHSGGALVVKLKTEEAGAAKTFSADAAKSAVINELRPNPTATAPPPVSAEPLPIFRQPMYESLRDYFPELFVPGLDQVPPNTIALLKTNPKFVEAYMAGLNHEMSRELVWREFPGDVAETFFQRFWDAPESGAAPDVPPIREWAGDLGSHASFRDNQLVLLMRGDLLRRFPAAVIYAVSALRGPDGKPALPPDATAETFHPRFRGTRQPDVVFLGFGVSEQKARGADGGPGIFIVIQEHPTEPRFGREPNAAASPAAANAAALAYTALRRAFRIAIHAAAILPRAGGR